MAQIILKACAPNASDRWQDPAQMGQALVNYMQTNRVNATPIISPVSAEPPIPEELPAEEPEEEELRTDDNGLTKHAVIQPKVSLNGLKQVFIITDFSAED